jgi:hypothetical protein
MSLAEAIVKLGTFKIDGPWVAVKISYRRDNRTENLIKKSLPQPLRKTTAFTLPSLHYLQDTTSNNCNNNFPHKFNKRNKFLCCLFIAVAPRILRGNMVLVKQLSWAPKAGGVAYNNGNKVQILGAEGPCWGGGRGFK